MKKILFLLLLCVLLFTSCVMVVDNDEFFTLDLIQEARERILAENPGMAVSFLEFSAGIFEAGDAGKRKDTSIDDLVWWNFAFDCDNGQTATISKEHGVWQPSHITSLILPGSSIFDTDYLRIDLDEAIKILKISHSGGGAAEGNLFDFVSFCQPLDPNVTEPLYIFHVGNGHFVSVGAITGTVQK